MAVIKNLKASCAYLKRAISQKENIILLSDADLDGVASLVILEESIQSLGGKVVFKYFPNREKDGYGLNKTALRKIKKFAPGVLILSDCGISSLDEVEKAKKLGFEVIIIDHHEILNDQLPRTPFVIDPKQAKDSYPFKLMAACGLCFKFTKRLLGKNMSPLLRESFLELVAIGTIADMMPEQDDNRLFIKRGLEFLNISKRPGILALREKFGHLISNKHFVQKIIAALQVTDFSKDNLPENYLLLASDNFSEAEKLSAKIIEKSQARRHLVAQIVEEVIAFQSNSSALVFFVEFKNGFPGSLTGGIASRVCNKIAKPSFITVCNKKGICRGSARSIKPVNLVEALNVCSDLFLTYGGHPQAAGFSLSQDNLKELQKRLEDYFSNNYQ